MEKENIELLGDRVIIKLDEAQDHTVKNGIIIPINTVVESEGGRVKTELSNQRHLAKGTIVQISQVASTKLQESNVDLKENDRVYVSHQVINSSSYHWKNDRSKLLSEFEGLVCIPHSLIEAKIKQA